MGYIGTKPSAVPLTSADITDGIITSAKIADGTIVNADINASAGVVFTKLASTGTLTVDNIKFPATQVASADANNLDDYEEGTWTPTFLFNTPGSSSFSYSVQTGRYTKIGRMIYASFSLTASITKGTASGDLYVSGLPFTQSVSEDFYTGYIGFQSSLNTDLIGFLQNGTSTNFFICLQGGGTLGASGVTDGTRGLRGTFNYGI